MDSEDAKSPGPRKSFFGNNTLNLNMSTLTDIIQQWVNTEFRNPPVIVNLKMNTTESVIQVFLGDKPPSIG